MSLIFVFVSGCLPKHFVASIGYTDLCGGTVKTYADKSGYAPTDEDTMPLTFKLGKLVETPKGNRATYNGLF